MITKEIVDKKRKAIKDSEYGPIIVITENDGSISVGQLWDDSSYENLIKSVNSTSGNTLSNSIAVGTSNNVLTIFELEKIRDIQVLSDLDIVRAIEITLAAQQTLKKLPTK